MEMIRTCVLLVSVVLVGCGGGGDGGGGEAPPDENVPVAAVFEELLTTQESYSASSADGLDLTVTFQPSADARFNTATAVSKLTLLSIMVRQGSTVLATETQPVYFRLDPLRFVAVQDRLVTASAIPEDADVPSSGRAFFEPGVDAGVFGVPPLEGTWSLEADGARNWLCLTTQLGSGLLSAPSLETTTITTFCFDVATDGTVSGFKASTATDERSTLARPVVDTIEYGP